VSALTRFISFERLKMGLNALFPNHFLVALDLNVKTLSFKFPNATFKPFLKLIFFRKLFAFSQ